MKQIFIASVLLFLFTQSYGQSNQVIGYKMINSYGLPKNTLKYTDFVVNEINQAFVALTGGIYIPKDSLWFIPPTKDFYFTSFATNESDTGLFVMANSQNYSQLFYLKSSLNGPIQKTALATVEKGLYNLLLSKGVCYVWGYTNNTSKIGIFANKKITWVLVVKGLIGQVRTNKIGDVIFSTDSSIFNLTTRKTILKAGDRIYGFDFDKDNNVILATSKGTGYVEDAVYKIVSPKVSGLVRASPKGFYVLQNRDNTLYEITSN